ncbi:hypothetical protein PAXRUDRAFT_178732 [Paxillus rubicundulus Ve08.2h10]|uniref:DDE-1 domain-containing protein n=1 Tax=Paxillus rubicundulus Ve08.2h10 TaxID=930991 RepID=A0A0D0CRA6_9AGAM|nr:hypothetical protein PAXRUDRAFT_178732 [Paxillus rubicundulus Ve08.2h10]
MFRKCGVGVPVLEFTVFCHICLLVDNFSSHSVSYQLINICLEFFEPNMTSFLQPCDAGIICCFKALYCCSLCSHTLDLDEAAKQEIYKINLSKGMMMAKKAWGKVTPGTIQHCWNHTQIQP